MFTQICSSQTPSRSMYQNSELPSKLRLALNCRELLPQNQTWQWNITMLSRRYIFDSNGCFSIVMLVLRGVDKMTLLGKTNPKWRFQIYFFEPQSLGKGSNLTNTHIFSNGLVKNHQLVYNLPRCVSNWPIPKKHPRKPSKKQQLFGALKIIPCFSDGNPYKL